jgi:leader peptidase (prepilin peptidase)/N-methyltransferase
MMGLTPWVSRVVALLLGLDVGSFLNVVIYRLPLGRSVIFPRSACPSCSAKIAWYDNLPLLSFLILGRRCRYCRGKISWQYPAIELLTGLVFLFIIIKFGITRQALACLILLLSLTVLGVIDIKSFTLPDRITLPGIFFGLLIGPWLRAPQLSYGDILNAYHEAFVGSAAGGWGLFLIGILGDWIFHRESMGGGDVKLAGMIGAFLGWKMVILTFLLASVLGALGGGLTMLLRGWRKWTLIPFGPYLALGSGITVFCGEEIWLRLTSFLGG